MVWFYAPTGLIKDRPNSPKPFVTDSEIISAYSNESPADAVTVMLSYAKSREVDDNVSVIVIGYRQSVKKRILPKRMPRFFWAEAIALAVVVLGGIF